MSEDTIPQMHPFPAKPSHTDDTTIAEEPSVNATIDNDESMMDKSEIMRDDTIDEKSMSTPLKPKEPVTTETTADADADADADETAPPQDEEDQDATGTSVLPLSRIKKIFKTDPEHISASEAAVFTTAIATELFIQYFTEQASLIARSEKRKKLQYKDFSAAVANIEQLYFLSETVPKTHNLESLVKTNKVKYAKESTLEKGQQTLQLGRKKAEEAKKRTDDEDLPDSDVEDLGDVDDVVASKDDTDGETDEEENGSNTQGRMDIDHDIIMADS